MKSLGSIHTARQGGFVLVATVWVLAGLAVAVGFLASWTEDLVERVLEEERWIDGELDKRGTEAAVVHLLLSRQMANQGLQVGRTPPPLGRRPVAVAGNEEGDAATAADSGFISIGGDVSQGVGSAYFSLQDEAGLLNIYNHGFVAELLEQFGVPREAAGPMGNKLIDYADPDDLVRVDGAERPAYENLGLRPPPNLPLFTTWQARNVLGWLDKPMLWDRAQLPRYTTLAPLDAVNPLAASPVVLAAIGAMNLDQATRLAEARATGDVGIMAATIREHAPMEWYRSDVMQPVPSRFVRLVLASSQSPTVDELHIELRTDQEFEARPWIVRSAMSIPRDRHWIGRSAGQSSRSYGDAERLFRRPRGAGSSRPGVAGQ